MSDNKAGNHRQKKNHTQSGGGNSAGVLTSGQLFFLKSELSLKKRFIRLNSRISSIEKDVLWTKRLLFSLWIPVLLNLLISYLRS
jgi:hypothetical protein